jgi:uncharacterized protein
VPDEPTRALVDTNVWVSAFITPGGPTARVLKAFLESRFVPVVSAALIEEIREVLLRDRIRRRYSPNDALIAAFIEGLDLQAIHVRPEGKLQLCRDPDDDFLLETAIQGNAHYAVSRDDDIKRDLDLIAHLQRRGVEVVSVAKFLEVLQC